mmetsp:Transcript_19083/g.35514  ORF Transcript_19083/g.35514 Transcript_19083/m.35514 type:complete len:91 (+) Transcript_19083:322-594(+)
MVLTLRSEVDVEVEVLCAGGGGCSFLETDGLPTALAAAADAACCFRSSSTPSLDGTLRAGTSRLRRLPNLKLSSLRAALSSSLTVPCRSG